MSNERNMNCWRLLPGILALMLATQDLSYAESGGASDFLDAVGELNAPAPQSTAPVSSGQPTGNNTKTTGAMTRTSGATAPISSHSPLVQRESEVATLTSELARMRAENAALRKKIRSAHSSAERADMAALQAKLAALQQHDEQQQAKLKQSEAARLRSEADAASIRAQMDKRTTPEVNAGLLTALQNRVKDLNGTVATLTTERDSLKTRLSQKASPGEGRQPATGGATSSGVRLRALTLENDTLRARVQALLSAQEQATSSAGRASAAQQQKTDELTRRMTALTSERDQLQKELGTLQHATAAEQMKVSQQFAERSQQVASLTTRLSAAEKENATLKAERDQRVKNRDAVDKAGSLKLAELQENINSLTHKLSTVTAERDKLRAGPDEAQKKNRDVVAVSPQQPVQADDMRQQLTALTARFNEVTKENAALKDRLSHPDTTTGADGASADKGPGKKPEQQKTLSLATDTQRQSYISGVMLAANVRRVIALQKDLGLKPDQSLLLAGISDEVKGSVLLDDTSMDKSLQALMSRLSKLEESKYKANVQTLEKRAAGKALLKRNGNVFFVQERKGSGGHQKGTPAHFDLTLDTLDGRTLMKRPGLSADPGNQQLPYLISQAVALGGPGALLSVYCFASDVWAPDQYPDGVFAYTPVRYQFRFEK